MLNSKENLRIIDEIHDVCDQIACTDTWFQLEDDEDLIEACIYQMEGLRAKYRYLLRRARHERINIPLFEKEA